jgi:hypothetical protein
LSPKTEYVILTEATLAHLLMRVMLRKPVCILACWSYLTGGGTSYLDRIAAWLRSRGRVTDMIHDHADVVTYPDEVSLIMGEDAFAANEAAIETIFAFSQSDQRLRRYGLAYRHAVCSRLLRRLHTMHIVRDACRMSSSVDARLIGLEAEDLRLYRARFGIDPSLSIGKARSFRKVSAFFSVVLALAKSVMWVLSATRWTQPKPREYLLGSDFCNDYRDLYMWREIEDRPDSTMVVFRNRALAKTGATLAAARANCVRTDGRFGFVDGLAAIVELVRDTILLLQRCWTLPSDIFRIMVTLPYKRMVYRGLFNRYRFQFFWGRADYNTDHIICSQELRARGGKSLGLMHGIPSICNVMHQLRHIDYDIYYAMGRHQYQRYYREKWPPHMAVRFIGSFGLTRDELHRLQIPRDRDFVFFVVPTTQGVAGLELIERVASAFPDRRLYISSKTRFHGGSYGAAVEALIARHTNVVLHSGRSYELLFKCSYAFSEGSTLAAEAAQAGLYSFTLDLVPQRWKVNYYRAFPGMCLGSADQVIERVRAIESGLWSYPYTLYADMIEMTGRVFYDIVRGDLGLAPKEGVLSHLAFVPGDDNQDRSSERSLANVL